MSRGSTATTVVRSPHYLQNTAVNERALSATPRPAACPWCGALVDDPRNPHPYAPIPACPWVGREMCASETRRSRCPMLPLSPDDIAKAAAPIPDFVIAAVNRCLTRQCRGGRAVLQQAEVIREILEANPEVTRSDLFDKRWLDFEPAFRAAGWDVEYDRPSYCETYEPAWRFSTAKAGAP